MSQNDSETTIQCSGKCIVLDDDPPKETTYILKQTTVENIPLLLQAFSAPFWHAKDGEDPDYDDEAECYLFHTLCSEPGQFDGNKIMNLLRYEANHILVMSALGCLLEYDIDMQEVYSNLDGEEEQEVRRIVQLLSLWRRVAEGERNKNKKKRLA